MQTNAGRAEGGDGGDRVSTAAGSGGALTLRTERLRVGAADIYTAQEKPRQAQPAPDTRALARLL